VEITAPDRLVGVLPRFPDRPFVGTGRLRLLQHEVVTVDLPVWRLGPR
jgi:hypothetical protein